MQVVFNFHFEKSYGHIPGKSNGNSLLRMGDSQTILWLSDKRMKSLHKRRNEMQFKQYEVLGETRAVASKH